MKTVFSLITILFALFTANAQDTLYFQNFDNYQEGDMTMIDNDGLTPYYSGLTTWKVTGGVAVSTSWYTNGDKTADDWMITPPITLGDNPFVAWEAHCSSANYPDGYEVLISTNISNPNDLNSFSPIFSTTAENTTWSYHKINISQYANQQILIAWRNNSTDKDLLYVDNILVYDAKPDAAVITNSQIPMFTQTDNPLTFKVKLSSFSSTEIDSFKISYAIDNITETFKGTSIIDAGSDADISITSSNTTSSDTIHSLKIWIDKINNTVYSQYDTIIKKFSSASDTAQNQLLVEHFTQASCGPCASQNPALNDLLSRNKGKVSHIAYHTWWPGSDPMYDFNTAPVRNRVSYYGVSGVPDVFANGTEYGSPQNITQNIIDQNYVKNAYVKILIDFQWKNKMIINVKLVPLTTFPDSVTLRTVLVENLRYSSPPGSNGETYFPDVMRQMFPDADGQKVRLIKNDTLSFAYEYDEPSQVYHGNCKVIAFIQVDKDKKVLATAEKDNIEILNVNDASNSTFAVYPNPASNFINLNLDNDFYKIMIFSADGKMVYNGTQRRINVADWPEGIFIISAVGTKNTKTAKFNVIK